MNTPAPPPRGFDDTEFKGRVARAQKMIHQAGLDALLLTTEADIRYFTGFLTRFWESPARPWFVVVPAETAPVAIIPSIGSILMEQTWIDDIRTWVSPDYEGEGMALLGDTLRQIAGQSGRVGIPKGPESSLRMPLEDFEALTTSIAPARICSDSGIVRKLRMVKSEAEIAKIRHACCIAAQAFEQVGTFAHEATPLSEVFRRFQMACLEAGADWVSYLAGGAGHGGYHDVISPAGPTPLQRSDILMLDTGLVWDGYFCDYDRNFAIEEKMQADQSHHNRLMDAVDAGAEAARPGATASDVHRAMDRILGGAEGSGHASRLGHGLGSQLTEWPSLTAGDQTPLEEGMVVTLEPCLATGDGRIMVHEENVVIRLGGVEYLSPKASRNLGVI